MIMLNAIRWIPLVRLFAKARAEAVVEAAAPPRIRKKVARWRWERHVVQAWTKSEARAQLKAVLGLTRLPIGANVLKLHS